MRLDIDSLRAFKMVLEQGGVTRAAQKLNLTQSAISHKLARLEERIGRPILYKAPHGLVPTADGSRLLGYADRIVALHDEAVDAFKQSDLAGEIRLGTTEDATESRLSSVLGRFRRSNPQASIHIRVAQSLMLKHWLETSEIDVAILQLFAHEQESRDIELWREDLLWVQSVDHPIPLGKTIPFVSFDKNSFYGVAAKQRLAEAGHQLDVVFECPSREGIKAAVMNGLGVTLLSRRNITAGLMEIPLGLPQFPQVCHVLRYQNSIAGALHKNLIDAVLREFKE
jgi:DNA-binding transcriptional LysR family regulator